MIHLPSLAAIPVTHTPTLKAFPALADGRAVWQEMPTNQPEIVSAPLPALQAVFQNANALAVTAGMVTYAQNAYGLLSLWGASGVQAVTEYSALVPQVLSQTAYFSNGAPAGVNFSLVPGSFLWVEFNSRQVLDLGLNNSSPLNLAADANVFGYTAFPDGYSAYQLLGQLGLSNALAVRMLDAESGRWRVAEVQNGALVGDNFPIPNVAVVMVGLAHPVSQFAPQSQYAYMHQTQFSSVLSTRTSSGVASRSAGTLRTCLGLGICLALALDARATTVANLQQQLAGGAKVVLIDVRIPTSFAQGHLPGAINIPASLCSQKRLPPLGRVVVYDDGLGRQSSESLQAAAAALAQKPGITVDILEGGFAAWETARGLTTRGRGIHHETLNYITYAQPHADHLGSGNQSSRHLLPRVLGDSGFVN